MPLSLSVRWRLDLLVITSQPLSAAGASQFDWAGSIHASPGVGKLFDWWGTIGSKIRKRGPEQRQMNGVFLVSHLNRGKQIYHGTCTKQVL